MDAMDTGDTLVQQHCRCGAGLFGIWLDTATGYYIVGCADCGDGFTLDGARVR
jgi:hypothetical protein